MGLAGSARVWVKSLGLTLGWARPCLVAYLPAREAAPSCQNVA